MDKKIEDRRWIKRKYWKYIFGGILIMMITVAFTLRDQTSTFRVEIDKVTIDEVNFGPFRITSGLLA